MLIFPLHFIFFCFAVTVAYAQLNFHGVSEKHHLGESKNDENRIIIVYPLNGCSEGSLSSESASTTINGLELQTPKGARTIALNELERRVNSLHSQKLQEDPTRRLLLPASEQEMSTKLSTRYLNAVQAEITQVPPFLSSDEMMELSSGLPCVHMVVKDYIKIVEETPTTRLNSYNEGSRSKHDYRHRNSKDNKAKNKCTVCDEDDDVNFTFDMSSTYRHLQVTNNASRHTTDRFSAESVRPNDQLFPDQWHLQESEIWGIQPQEEWQEWRGSSSMVVAIIDSGCDLNHPDLAQKKWVNSGEICGDGIDNDRNGYVDDCYGWDWVDNDNSPLPEGSGHGTAAAGIIAASTNNMIGISGICWECRIMCLRFIKGVEGRVSNQVAAIDYATKMGAKISNNSYGGYGYSRLEYEIINRARSYGHLFVSSAGNNNYNTDLPQYDHTPSIYNIDNILAVGANVKSGKKATFSNYGKVSVDLFAPGSRIVTVEAGGSYAVVSGTSFAAPMASGVAGLIWSRFPSLSSTEIIKSMVSSCKKSAALEDLAVCGGVLNVDSAIIAASNMVGHKAGSNFVRGASAAAVNTNKKPAAAAAEIAASAASERANRSNNSGSSSSSSYTSSSLRTYPGLLGTLLSSVNKALNPLSAANSEEVRSGDTVAAEAAQPGAVATAAAKPSLSSSSSITSVTAVEDDRVKESSNSPAAAALPSYLVSNSGGLNEVIEKIGSIASSVILNSGESNSLTIGNQNAWKLKEKKDNSESTGEKGRVVMASDRGVEAARARAAGATESEAKNDNTRLNERDAAAAAAESPPLGLFRFGDLANNGIGRISKLLSFPSFFSA